MNHWKQSNYKRPTYYTMITLFDQNRKYYIQNNKTLHLVSQIALQVSSLIDTTEPSSSVPGNSDRHALPLTEGNFEIILNMDKSLVYVMRYCVIKSICIPNCRWNWFFYFLFFFKCENINFHKQSKKPTKYQDLSIAPLRRSVLNFNDLDCHVQFFLKYWMLTWSRK